MKSYPLMINIYNERIVVIGGGKVATRKITSLLNFGANIEVISPSISDTLKELQRKQKIKWVKKEYEKEDIENAFIVIAATNNTVVNKKVVSHCKLNQLKINVSEPSLGNVMMPAILNKGSLQISVSTNGASPIMAKKIRDEIKKTIDDRLVELLDKMLNERRKIINDIHDPKKRNKLFHKKAKDIF